MISKRATLFMLSLSAACGSDPQSPSQSSLGSDGLGGATSSNTGTSAGGSVTGNAGVNGSSTGVVQGDSSTGGVAMTGVGGSVGGSSNMMDMDVVGSGGPGTSDALGGSGGSAGDASSMMAAAGAPSMGAGGFGSSNEGGGNVGGTGGAQAGAANEGGTGGTVNEPEGTAVVYAVSTDGTVRAFSMSEDDGALTMIADHQVANGGDHFLAVGPDHRTVFVSYAAGVSVLDFDLAQGAFGALDEASTFGGGTHVAVDPTGTHVMVAHYNEGGATYLSFDGASFSTGTQLDAGQNAHSSRFHPTSPWVYVPCLGSNHLAQYAVDGGGATALSPATTDVSGGPRHMAFHPSGNFAYVLSELSGELHVRAVDSGSGSLDNEIDLEVLGGAGGAGGDKKASDVQITPNGQHVYAIDRNQTAIYHFSVAGDGTLTASAGSTNLGAVVRAFGMDPKGAFLQVGDEQGNLRPYAINDADGSLTQGAQPVTGLGNIHATSIRYLAQ